MESPADGAQTVQPLIFKQVVAMVSVSLALMMTALPPRDSQPQILLLLLVLP
jgi:hypothetical protein